MVLKKDGININQNASGNDTNDTDSDLNREQVYSLKLDQLSNDIDTEKYRIKDIGKLFINDHLMIVSYGNQILFYRINYDYSNNYNDGNEYKSRTTSRYNYTNIPTATLQLIQQCTINPKMNKNSNNKNEDIMFNYSNHGMCCLKYCQIDKWKNQYFLSFLILGGENTPKFTQSFVKFDVQLIDNSSMSTNTLQLNKRNNGDINDVNDKDIRILDINQTLIDNISGMNNDDVKIALVTDFDCHCLINKHNERIIVIINGCLQENDILDDDEEDDTNNVDSMILYNVDQNKMIKISVMYNPYVKKTYNCQLLF